MLNKNVKICVIAHNLHPIKEPFAGGLEFVTKKIVDELTDIGYDVYLYAHKDSVTKAKLIPFLTWEDFISEFPSPSHTGGCDHINVLYQKCMLDILNKDFDIVHNMSLHYVPIVFGEFIGKKFITSFHTPRFPELNFALELIKQNNIKQNFSVVSKSQISIWSDLSKEINVIYNGIELDEWEFYKNKSDYYFWFGRICPEKGTHHAIEACMKAKKTLLIAGPKSNLEYYDEKVMPFVDNINVKYLGHLDHENIKTYLKHAKAFLFTSVWNEPFGVTIIESLASGTPVIAFPVGATSEILTSDDVGIILKEISSEALYDELIADRKFDYFRCREIVEKKFSVQDMVFSYLNLYNSILKHE